MCGLINVPSPYDPKIFKKQFPGGMQFFSEPDHLLSESVMLSKDRLKTVKSGNTVRQFSAQSK